MSTRLLVMGRGLAAHHLPLRNGDDEIVRAVQMVARHAGGLEDDLET
jgi:hypothetical protein